MSFKRKYRTHSQEVDRLLRKKRLAEIKCEERKLKYEILKLYIPILGRKIKFNKLIVTFCIASIIFYTIAAILLQKYTSIELSPTLTTCVFAFFGTELLGLAGIKICDTRFTNPGTDVNSDETVAEDPDAVG